MSDTKEIAEKTDFTPFLKFALEIGPLAVFFILNSRTDIFYATGGFMIATVISLTLSKIFMKRIPIMPLVSGVFVLIFGFLTIYLQNEIFIKLKPTIINLLFASILFTGLYFNKLLLKILLGEVLHLRDDGWRILTLRWIGLFIFLALLNEFVWRNFETNTWAAFKLFGVMPITFIFMISQIPLIMKYQVDETPEKASEANPS